MTPEEAEKNCHPECGWKTVYINHKNLFEDLLDDTVHVTLLTRDLANFLHHQREQFRLVSERLETIEEKLSETPGYSDRLGYQSAKREIGYSWSQ
tara:strand:- start:2125 stop:2409 length:285 start_codon:yes stop_codon:yes gene_type:complete